MENSKILATPMSTSCFLDKYEDGKSVDEQKYWGIIVSLFHLTASCPDIIFVVCMCACFQVSPK